MTEAIDYSYVPQRHLEIQSRLETWAKWVRVGKGSGWQSHPMWKEFRSGAWQWHYLELKTPINTLEAMETEKQVSKLPEKHRDAIRWCYVFQDGPVNMARKLGVSKQGLADLVMQGRDMLKNRLHS